MQAHRTNRERSDTTREALLSAARALFVAQGYAVTSTPAVCTAAGLTRGALYHHFADKRDLFREVLEREAEAVNAAILAAVPPRAAPAAALLAGAEAYLDAMAEPGRTRLLLVEAPAVLGVADAMAVDEGNAEGTLGEGLAAALGERAGVSLPTLARLLSSAFDRAALDIDAGADRAEVRRTMGWLLRQVLAATMAG